MIGVIGLPRVGKLTIMNELYGVAGSSLGNIYIYALTLHLVTLMELLVSGAF